MPDDARPQPPSAFRAPELKAPLGMRKTLADIAALIAGGSHSRAVLGELTRRLAHDVAGYFDDLPMHLFGGDVRRAEGIAGRLLPTRRVKHRLLLGRYRRSNPRTVFPSGTTKGGWIHHPHIGLVALGVDGALRVGEWSGLVRLPTAEAPAFGLFPWSHPQLRGVPPGHLVLEEWQPRAQERDVADPAEVIAALQNVATDLAQLAARDAAVIRGESA